MGFTRLIRVAYDLISEIVESLGVTLRISPCFLSAASALEPKWAVGTYRDLPLPEPPCGRNHRKPRLIRTETGREAEIHDHETHHSYLEEETGMTKTPFNPDGLPVPRGSYSLVNIAQPGRMVLSPARPLLITMARSSASATQRRRPVLSWGRFNARSKPPGAQSMISSR